MQSLRGLAELGELAPLPEILDGIELGDRRPDSPVRAAARRARGDGRRRARAHPALARHRRARATGPRGTTRRGSSPTCCCAPSPSSGTSCRSSRCTMTAIRRLRHLRAGQPQFEAPAPLGPLELVSHGEHLCQIADLIARSTTRHGARSPPLPSHRRAAHRERARPGSGRRGARGLRPLDPRGAGGRCLGPVGRRAGGEPQGRRRAAALGRRRRRPDAGLAAHPRRGASARPGAHGSWRPAEPAPAPTTSPTSCRSPVSRPIPSPTPAGADALEISFRTLERLQRERGPARPRHSSALAGRAAAGPGGGGDRVALLPRSLGARARGGGAPVAGRGARRASPTSRPSGLSSRNCSTSSPWRLTNPEATPAPMGGRRILAGLVGAVLAIALLLVGPSRRAPRRSRAPDPRRRSLAARARRRARVAHLPHAPGPLETPPARRSRARPLAAWPLWHAMAIGFMANNLLPFRAGELVRVFAATKLAGRAVHRGDVVHRGRAHLRRARRASALLGVGLLASDLPPGIVVGGVSLAQAAQVAGLLAVGALLAAGGVVAFPAGRGARGAPAASGGPADRSDRRNDRRDPTRARVPAVTRPADRSRVLVAWRSGW